MHSQLMTTSIYNSAYHKRHKRPYPTSTEIPSHPNQWALLTQNMVPNVPSARPLCLPLAFSFSTIPFECLHKHLSSTPSKKSVADVLGRGSYRKVNPTKADLASGSPRSASFVNSSCFS